MTKYNRADFNAGMHYSADVTVNWLADLSDENPEFRGVIEHISKKLEAEIHDLMDCARLSWGGEEIIFDNTHEFIEPLV